MASSVQEVLSEQLLKAAAVVEGQLDQQMERMDHLGEDDLEAIRRRRMQEIKKKQLEKQEWLLKGHGEYEELPDERSFFEATKKSSRFVAHFFRQSTDRCKIVDMHLKGIASRHVETRFVRVNVEKFPFLTQRLNIRMIPTICIIIDSKTVDYIRGFDDLGGTDEFRTETLEWRLARKDVPSPSDIIMNLVHFPHANEIVLFSSGVIDYDGPSGLPERGGKLKKIGKSSKKTIRGKDDEDSDDDW